MARGNLEASCLLWLLLYPRIWWILVGVSHAFEKNGYSAVTGCYISIKQVKLVVLFTGCLCPYTLLVRTFGVTVCSYGWETGAELSRCDCVDWPTCPVAACVSATLIVKLCDGALTHRAVLSSWGTGS